MHPEGVVRSGSGGRNDFCGVNSGRTRFNKKDYSYYQILGLCTDFPEQSMDLIHGPSIHIPTFPFLSSMMQLLLAIFWHKLLFSRRAIFVRICCNSQICSSILNRHKILHKTALPTNFCFDYFERRPCFLLLVSLAKEYYFSYFFYSVTLFR